MSGRDIRIGHDKQPAPVVPVNAPLYNLLTGKVLTDEGGTPLVSEQDTALASAVTKTKSTSVVFTDEKSYSKPVDKKLTGINFEALNNAVYQVELTEVGGGYSTGGQFTVPAGSLNAVISYEVDETTGSISSLEVVFGGNGYTASASTTYTINGGTAGNLAEYKIVAVTSLVRGQNSKFTEELEVGDVVELPTAGTTSVKALEVRKVVQVLDDQQFLVSLAFTNQRKRLGNGTGFGKIVRRRFLKVNPVLPVSEAFPTFSEVSTSILGIPKAETQLGLFSNVSSYGLDDDAFLYYRRDDVTGDPTTWGTRKNRNYGRHFDASRYVENTDESAIVLDTFRTPYAYPYGPNANQEPFPLQQHITFCNFLKIGCLLYDWFKPGGQGYQISQINDGGTFALNFVPYAQNHFSTDGYILDNNIINTKPSPYYDTNGLLITPFSPNEDIYKLSDWNTTTNQPNAGAQPIGKFLDYHLYDATLHFTTAVGLLHTLNGNNDLVVIGATSKTKSTITGDMTFNEAEFFMYNMIAPQNPLYPSQQAFFDQIDTWTETWRDIKKGLFKLPNGTPYGAEEVDTNPLIKNYIVDALGLAGIEANVFQNSRPGYQSTQRIRSYLVSRQAFRYQPGRISGYTFGVRAAGDASTNAVRIEWGIGNDTDELMFQISGANLSIVRRSVVPLTDKLLADNGFSPSDQYPITLDTQNNESFTDIPNRTAYELKIPRDLWNGDPLNGNGPSKWNWSAEAVTMYKIEFGWYGAIGVRFYAYVPVENNEARWVKLHTLVIENQLGQPCMGDPYYKFKYALLIDDLEEVRSPQYIYKYGTSCYIDGGDQGTIKVGAATSQEKTSPVQLVGGVKQSTTLVGLIPKTVIYNQLGLPIKNKQSIFPRELSVNSNGLTEISLVKCSACPGFGHTYQTNVSAGYLGDERYVVNPQLFGGAYDRSTLELLPLYRNATGTSGQFTIQLTGINTQDPSQEANPTLTQFMRVGDIVQPDDSSASNPVFEVPPGTRTYITAIDKVNNTITTNNPLRRTISNFGLQIQPLFIGALDEYAKVIGQRVFLTYIKDRAFFSGSQYQTTINGVNYTGYTTTKLVTIDSSAVNGTQDAEAFRYFIDKSIPSFIKINSQVIPNDTRFPVRLSQYKHVAGSTLPVVGKDNSLLFLLPNYWTPDQGSFNTTVGNQSADWRIGITSLRPTQPGGVNSEIVWEKSDGTIVPEFKNEFKLYAERFSEGIFRDIEGFEISEYDIGRTPPFTVDYRIPQPPGTNTGRCAYVRITIDDAVASSCQQLRGSDVSQLTNQLTSKFQEVGHVFNPNGYYLRFAGNTPFNYDPTGAEIGFNSNNPNPLDPNDPAVIPSVGSNIRFVSNFIEQEDDQGVKFYYAPISGQLYNSTGITDIKIYTIPVNLETYRKLATKSFDYNPFPLFFFIEMRDGCRINGPVIKEVSQVPNVYNPRWIGSPTIDLENGLPDPGFQQIEVGPTGDTKFTTGDTDSLPPNFTTENRLSSTLVDTQSTSQLRPYEVIDRFYVGDQTTTIDLRSIFDFQKESITPDLLNTTAYFFIATSREATSTQVSGTLNYIEQQ